jgi:hypothetical protein
MLTTRSSKSRSIALVLISCSLAVAGVAGLVKSLRTKERMTPHGVAISRPGSVAPGTGTSA